jgi:hypothetical protein
MKVELHTMRWGQETPLLFHGSAYAFRPDVGVLIVYGAVQQNGDVALEHVITTVAGDDFVVVQCDESCDFKSHHAVTTDTVFPQEP